MKDLVRGQVGWTRYTVGKHRRVKVLDVSDCKKFVKVIRDVLPGSPAKSRWIPRECFKSQL